MIQVRRPRNQAGIDLRIPGQKPRGPVEINWSHPLARGLGFYTLFGSTARDIVGNASPNLGSGYAVTGNDFDATSDGLPVHVNYDKNEMPDLSGGFTVFIDFIAQHNHNSANVNFRVFLDNSDNSTDGIRIYQRNNTDDGWRFRLLTNGGSGTNLDVDSSDFLVGDRVKLAVSWDQSTMRIYEGGRLLGSTGKTGTLASTFAFNTWVNQNPEYAFDSVSANALYKSLGIFTRALSDVEIAYISANPYAFLREITRPIPIGAYVSTGGGPTIHNVSINESLSLSDVHSAVMSASASRSEALSLSDTPAAVKSTASSLTESAGLSETQSASMVAAANQSESVSLAESSDGNIGATTVTGSITESLSLDDTPDASAVLNASVSESIALSDLVDGATGVFGYLSESLSLSDQSSATTVIAAATVETANLDEQSTTVLITNADITEVMSLIDQVSNTVHFEASATESISLADIQDAALAQIHAVSITESINLTDFSFVTSADFVAGNINVWRLEKRGSTWLLPKRGTVWKLRGK